MYNTIVNYLKIGQTVYSAVHGKELIVLECRVGHINPIALKDSNTGNLYYFTETGAYVQGGECMLFPSKTCRDWQKHNNKVEIWPNYTTNVSIENIKIKYSTNALEPFTPVLVRNGESLPWKMNFFSHMHGKKYVVMCGIEYSQCIPYNESTKHLLKNETD